MKPNKTKEKYKLGDYPLSQGTKSEFNNKLFADSSPDQLEDDLEEDSLVITYSFLKMRSSHLKEKENNAK